MRLLTGGFYALEVKSEVGEVVRNMLAKFVFLQNYFLSLYKVVSQPTQQVKNIILCNDLRIWRKPKEPRVSSVMFFIYKIPLKTNKQVGLYQITVFTSQQPQSLQPMVSDDESCSSVTGSLCIVFYLSLRTLLFPHGSTA